MTSSAEKIDGGRSKRDLWACMLEDRKKESFWNHFLKIDCKRSLPRRRSYGFVTQSFLPEPPRMSAWEATAKAAVQTTVMVYAWNGNKKVSTEAGARFHWITSGTLPVPTSVQLEEGNCHPFAARVQSMSTFFFLLVR